MKMLLLPVVVLPLFAVPAYAEHCPTPLKIDGRYQCSGECVVTSDGKQSLIQVIDETDVITSFPGSRLGQYQVNITSGSFSEIEIGPLHRCVLYTATSQVSDQHYPVLEEYYFTSKRHQATGFTKIVRNPDPVNFKTCKIQCRRVNTP